jgi:hypothetical protein
MKIDNIKEEVTYDMENFRKKEWNRNRKHNRRPLQTEDSISELQDEMEIKGKTEELLSNNSRPGKEYARSHQLHQKTKPENHRH